MNPYYADLQARADELAEEYVAQVLAAMEEANRGGGDTSQDAA